MARRSNRRDQRNRSRDALRPPRTSLRPRATRILQRVKLSDGRIVTRRPTYKANLINVSDRRRWHPSTLKPIKNIYGVARNRITRLPSHMYFNNPLRVDICVRRKIRRTIMFALGGAGGGRRMRKPRRNENSNIRC